MRFIRENRGSASLEFVLLAIPLFLPIFIFMNFFAESTDTQTSLRTLAREAARTYVTSKSDEIAAEVMETAKPYAVRVHLTQRPRGGIEVSAVAEMFSDAE